MRETERRQEAGRARSPRGLWSCGGPAGLRALTKGAPGHCHHAGRVTPTALACGRERRCDPLERWEPKRRPATPQATGSASEAGGPSHLSPPTAAWGRPGPGPVQPAGRLLPAWCGRAGRWPWGGRVRGLGSPGGHDAAPAPDAGRLHQTHGLLKAVRGGEAPGARAVATTPGVAPGPGRGQRWCPLEWNHTRPACGSAPEKMRLPTLPPPPGSARGPEAGFALCSVS